MATTTRQFHVAGDRISETMSTQHHHGSAPQTISPSRDNADTIRLGQPVSAAISPPTTTAITTTTTTTTTPTIRATQAFCRNCRSKIGDFYNSWHRVTGSYYAPSLLGSYTTSLHSTGKPKPAAKGTDVEGCTIQLLICPHPGCGETPIGFTVIAAPAGKRKFRGRDLFKLSRIELQCEISPGQFIIIEPQEDTAPDLSAAEQSPSPFSPIHSPKTSSAEAMEVDSRLPSLHHSTYSRSPLGLRYDHDQGSPRQQPAYLIEHDTKHFKTLSSSMPSPPVTNVSHGAIQTAPGKTLPPSPPAAEPLRQTESPQQKRIVLPEPQTNGHQYPRSPGAISMDAIERLQTQISQNSGALAAHTRDIRRSEESFQHLEETLRREFQDQLFRQSADIQKVEESAARLQHEMQSIRHVMESFSREMEAWRMDKQSQKSVFSPGHPLSAQDSALELMAQQIAVMSHKTSDLDNLKLHIEIMKNKIYRLEENAKSGLSQSTSHTHQLPREAGAPPAQPTHATIHSHPSTPTLAHGSDPTRRVSNVQQHQPAAMVALETTQRTEPLPSQSNGWATINTAVKRNSHSGMNSPQEATTHGPSSPKRQKLGDAEPFPVAEARFSTPAHGVPSQNPIPDSVPSSQSQQPLYSPYTPQYRPSDETLRSDSQPMTGFRPRGRGRGGGPGSRGGRVRKSMLVQPHSSFGTPEWESDEWQGLRSSQGSPEGFHSHMVRSGRGGIARRGSGGSGSRGGYATSDRAASLGLQGVAGGISFGPPGETYGSAKRTRTKPVRNADGVLIRKDGRPDMRSQSSAANLRKVHARKEQDSSHSPTPTNVRYAASADATDTPSPAGVTVPPSATDKHKAIMGKIFPGGLTASRKQQDYASQVFADDCDHTIHTRSHAHRSAAKTDKTSQEEEQHERNGHVDKGQSRQEQDVDMDEAEDRADDDGQTRVGPAPQLGQGNEAADGPKEEQNGTLVDSRAGSESRAVESLAADEADCIHVKAK